MVPKASQRAGGQQLATHLMNAFDNERVEVADVRGAIAPDLHGAFAEWRAMSKATQCRKYLYSLSINPPRPITREQYLDFIERVERGVGLKGQPRALVFHVKHGREHAHVIWSRIDPDRLRAVQISHDRRKLQRVAREFARDHGLELPPGMRREGARERFNDRARPENLAEKQQEERTGITKDERCREITDAWRGSADGPGFVRGLEDRGYILARGDRRGYVVIDRYGEIHSLARQITGARAKDVRARLAAFALDALPSVAEARTRAAASRERQLQDKSPDREGERTLARRRDSLRLRQDLRRQRLEGRQQALARQHALERDTLTEAHRAETAGVAAQRLRDRPRGVLLFLARITGYQLMSAVRDRVADRQRTAEHGRQLEALARRHQREMKDFGHHVRALACIEKRELRSLHTMMRRERFRELARGPVRLAPAFARQEPSREALSRGPGRLRTFFDKLRGLAGNAGPAEERTPEPLSTRFAQAAEPAPPAPSAAREFRDAAAPRPPDLAGSFSDAHGGKEPRSPALSDFAKNAQDITLSRQEKLQRHIRARRPKLSKDPGMDR